MKAGSFTTGLLCFLILTKAVNAQKHQALSIHYNYSVLKNSEIKEIYPLGVGSSYSIQMLSKFQFNLGLDFSFLHNKHNSHLYGQPSVITTTNYKGSVYSLSVGAFYPIINKKVSVKIGSNIISSYVHDRWNIVVYDVPEIVNKFYHDRFGLGINADINIEYSLIKEISVFIQPGYTCYMFGDFKKNKILNCSGGVVYKF